MDTTTQTARGDRAVRVPRRDPPADEREIHVRVTSVDGVDDGLELLGRIQVSGRDDQHVVARDAEPRAEPSARRSGGTNVRILLDDGMRHDEDRRSAPEVLEIP